MRKLFSNLFGSIPSSLLSKAILRSLKSLSFPNASIGNPGEVLTGPPIKKFGGDKFGQKSRDCFLIPRQLAAAGFIPIFILSLALSACSLAPKFERPDMAIPGTWSNVPNVGQQSQQDGVPFWKAFGNQELNRLIDTALAQNLDLEAALHRIEQARAQVKVVGSALYPSIQASGSSTQTYKQPLDTSVAQGLGSISYEVDLWGKNRNATAAANYRATASGYDRDALRLVITSDVTNFYTQILAFNDRIRMAENNLKNAEEVLRIIEARYSAG